MKIAQVAPLFESVPPQLYGGTERVVSFLTEELVQMGHQVTLFASGDSVTNARLVASSARALRLDPDCTDCSPHQVLQLERVLQKVHEFDVLHFHTDYSHFPVARALTLPQVSTLHGRLNIPDLISLYEEFGDMPVVSISKAQRTPLAPYANWVGNVYHGLPLDLLSLNEQPGDYLAFLGRLSSEKRADRAIEIAVRTGLKLRMAAKVDPSDREYFERLIKPLLSHPLVEYIGEIDDREKNDFLGKARALLFPIDWPEPFGLAMIEALACGCPVIAFPSGSVPEVIDHGVTGFVVDDIDDAVQAVYGLDKISRRKCRQVFEKRFSVSRMAKEYVEIYESIIEQNRWHQGKNQDRRRQIHDLRRPDIHTGEFPARRASRPRPQT